MKKLIFIFISLLFIPSVNALTLKRVETSYTYNQGKSLDYYVSGDYSYPFIPLRPLRNSDEEVEVELLDYNLVADSRIENLYLNYESKNLDYISNEKMALTLDSIYRLVSTSYNSNIIYPLLINENDNLDTYNFDIVKDNTYKIYYNSLPYSTLRCNDTNFLKFSKDNDSLKVTSNISGIVETSCEDETRNEFLYFGDGKNVFITLNKRNNDSFKIRFNVIEEESDYDASYDIYNLASDYITFDKLIYNAGDLVSFKLDVPNFYKVDNIIIKDFYNNIIESSNNTFIMPNSEVFVYLELSKVEDVYYEVSVTPDLKDILKINNKYKANSEVLLSNYNSNIHVINNSNNKEIQVVNSKFTMPYSSILIYQDKAVTPNDNKLDLSVLKNLINPSEYILPLNSSLPNINIYKDNDDKEVISTPLLNTQSSKEINNYDTNYKKIIYISLFIICILSGIFIVKKMSSKR